MATPAAVLSILVDANTTEATAKLTEYQHELSKANATARKGIETRLGGRFNREAFSAYDHATRKAMDRAANRAAFRAELGAHYSPAGFRAYQRELEHTGRQAKETGHSLRGLAQGALAAGAAFAAYDWGKTAIENTIALGGATLRLSAITGADAKTASTWIEVMKSRGIQAQAAGMTFITLSRNIRNAENGSKTATRAFRQLGISQDEIKGKDPTQVILRVADGLQSLTDPAQRAAIAQQLFGRSAKQLLPVLSQGSRGLRENLDMAQKYGAYLPKNTKNIKDAVEASHALEFAQQGLEISFSQAVLPTLVKVSQKVLGFVVQMREGAGVGGQFRNAISSAFSTVKDVVGGVVSVFGGLGNTITIALAAFATYKIFAFSAALVALFDAIEANPIGLVLVGVGLLATALFGLIGAQNATATSARDVASAWRDAKQAANSLADAHLDVMQARLDEIRTAGGQAQAQKQLNAAVSRFGPNSFQARQAQINLTQATLDHKRAAQGIRDALDREGNAQRNLTAKNQAAVAKGRSLIQADRDRIRSLKNSASSMSRAGTNATQLRRHTRDLAAAERKLKTDTENLRGAQTRARGATNRFGGAQALAKGHTDQLTGSVNDLTGALNAIPPVKTVTIDILVRAVDIPGFKGGKGLGRLSKFPSWAAGLAGNLSSSFTPPSETTGSQVRSQTLQNTGSTRAQIAYNRQQTAADQRKLAQINSQLGGAAGTLTRQQRHALLENKLSVLQALGSLNSDTKSLSDSLHSSSTGQKAAKRASDASTRSTNAAASAADARAKAEQAAAAALARWQAYWSAIPSQGTAQQIRKQAIENAIATAHNAGNVGKEIKGTRSELKLEKQWLASDAAKLRKINRELAKRGLSRSKRQTLLEDKLALMQEIGTITSDVGSLGQSLTDLANPGASASTAGGGGFSLAPTGANVTLPTMVDVTKAVRGHGPAVVHHNHVTVNVTKHGDEHKVAEVLDRMTGSLIHARMRAAGMRGT